LADEWGVRKKCTARRDEQTKDKKPPLEPGKDGLATKTGKIGSPDIQK